MTDRERQYADLGYEYAEGIEQASKVQVLDTGRFIYKLKNGWECQPFNDNYWKTFPDLIEAIKFASYPKPVGV